MKLLYASAVAALMLICFDLASSAFAEDVPEHPVAVVQCEPLPPAGNAEVAKIFNKLVVPGVCPAGQYPRRYGSGEDLSQYERCMGVTSGYRRFSNAPLYDRPITDPVSAKGLASSMLKVEPCPPGTFWEPIPDPEAEKYQSKGYMRSEKDKKPLSYNTDTSSAQIDSVTPSSDIGITGSTVTEICPEICPSALTRLAPLGTLSRQAGEG